MVTCTRPAEDQTNKNPSMAAGGALEALPLAEELLTIDSSCGRESHFLGSSGPGLSSMLQWMALCPNIFDLVDY